MKVGERGRLAIALTPQVVLDRLVQGEAIGHLRRGEHWDLEHVLEAIEQRATLVVIDRLVRDGEHIVGAERG